MIKEIAKMDAYCCEKKLKTLFFLILNYFKQWNRLRFWRNISLIQNEELRKRCRELIRKQEAVLGEILYDIFKEGNDAKEIKYLSQQGTVSLYFAAIKGVIDIMFIYQDSDMDLQLFFDKIWSEYWFAIKN